MEELLLLKNPEISPTDEVIEKNLGKVYPVYQEIIGNITVGPYNLVPEWRYYNDGKAWLCKVVHKKKTIFWLSLWDKSVHTAFYFTEKTSAGIYDLPIAEEIKTDFKNMKRSGKFMPLILMIDSKEQVRDFLEIVKYKVSLK